MSELDPEDMAVLPARLAEAAAAVLAVDGVGLSLFGDEFRLPLGASGPDAATAERLQFTVEQGPCWDAVGHDLQLAVDAAQIAAAWPQFSDELRRQTPFRSVVSVPLRLARRTGGAVDLYFVDPTAASAFDVGDVTAVAAHMAETLNRAADDVVTDVTGVLGGPRWLRTDAARARTGVWIAAGMLVGDGVASAGDGVALLRAAAYSEGSSVDDVAAEVLDGTRSAAQVRDVR